ncbi:MAG: DegV family protein [Chloroflexi bacterium]|nr:MAG: DegV family protein [Chloroflexota bacterium]MBL1195405.1 DegV family protein [Chloroflexota bacterium]NOH12688.1 DegV family protein [Chloroflexota bacterium]
MTIKIVADSTCDLPPDIIDKYDISIVPLYINVGDEGYLDGVDITRAEFYENLPQYRPHPTTGISGPDSYREVYEKLTVGGAKEILSIHISESLSAVMDAARVAAKEFTAAKVTVFDSRQLSMGSGFLVEAAARMASAGESMHAILKSLEDQIKRTFVVAGLDTLEYLRRGGRVNGLVAGMGNVLQLKPLLTMYDGVAGTERVRTSARAIQRISELLHERAPIERLALVYTDNVEKAKALRSEIEDLLPDGEVPLVGVTPVIGAHIGPNAAGFAAVSAKK